MWNKSARLLMVRVKVTRHRGLAFPVPLWVVGEFLEALMGLAWVGEMVIRRIPLPRDEKAIKNLSWVRTISLSGIIATTHSIIKDLSRYKGQGLVDVEAGEVQVKISIR